MSAICYWCQVKLPEDVQPISNPKGVANSPFGACCVCSVFACGQHGDRSSNPAKFGCVECIALDSVWSRAFELSAIASIASNDEQKHTLDQIVGSGTSLPYGEWAITSVEDFRNRFPNLGDHYANLAEEWEIDFDRMDDPVLGQALNLVDNLENPDDQRKLLIVSGLMVKNIPGEHLTWYMREIRQAVYQK